VRLLAGPAQRLLLFTEEVTTISPSSLEGLGLTRRETEVLVWVAQGKTNEEIARILGLSHRTVAKHLEKIYPKLGLENRTAAAARARDSSGIGTAAPLP
jgi:DNA-binding CsgD family transcriptional regulator